ncbi:MAG: tetratricopeptide repeat protein [Deltaproteobacteria bacterium]|nr:tetratricopeptide repeat protein [Deltaproteobacteria bacterium]
MRHPAAFIALFAVVFIVYSNTFNSPFLFDDKSNIVKNYSLDNLSLLWPPTGMRYFTRLTFALNYYFNGLSVKGYHIVNILIHASASCLVYLMAHLTFKTPVMKSALTGKGDAPFYASLAAALIFAVHPLQTSAVTYIVQRHASLAALFYLLSLVLFISYRSHAPARERIILLIMSLVTAVMAQMTKENSITLPVVIVLYDLVFFNDVKGAVKRLITLSPYIAVFAIIPLTIIVIKTGLSVEGFLEATQTVSGMVSAVMSPYQYLINQFRVAVTYIRLLFLPFNQNLDYDYPVSDSIFEARIILSLLFLLSALGASLYVFVRSRRSGNGLLLTAACGVFWFFITLSVESTIIPIKDIIFEHRLYLPLAGVAIGFSFAALWFFFFLKERFGVSTPLYVTAVIFIALTALPLGIAAYARNGVWSDTVSLWSDVASKSPNKPRVHNNLGNAYREGDRVAEAIKAYKTAVLLDPELPEAHNNLGDAYMAQNTPETIDEAIKEFGMAVKYRPNYAAAHNNLGNAYHAKGMTQEAVKAFNESLKYNPANSTAYYNLGVLYEEIGRYDVAVDNYRMFIKFAPSQFTAQKAIVKGIIEDLSGKKGGVLKTRNPSSKARR